jgi:hypothetical protein
VAVQVVLEQTQLEQQVHLDKVLQVVTDNQTIVHRVFHFRVVVAVALVR